MKNGFLTGYMYSFITKDGRERLLTYSFGPSKTKAKKHFNAGNYLTRLEPVKPHKLYSVTISINAEEKLKENDGLS